MKYDNLRAFSKHLESATPNHFSPLYLILGKDSFECSEAVNLVLNSLVSDPKQRHLAVQTIDGSQSKADTLIMELNSPSFFVKKRLFLVQNVEKLKKTILEQLEKYFSHIDSTQYIILSGSAIAKNTTFYKQAEKAGVILDLPELKPWEKEKNSVEWLNKKVAESRKLISYQTCQILVKQVGSDKQLLSNELEKLFCYVGDKQEISLKDVENISVKLPFETIWQLGEAIFRRDTPVALKIMTELVGESDSILPLLRQLRSQFVTEGNLCRMLMDGRTSQEITAEYPHLRDKILEKHSQLAKMYGLLSFKKALLAVDAAEIKIKNTQIDEQLLAELLILQLTIRI